MSVFGFTSLILITFGVAVGATIMLVLNVTLYARYAKEAKLDQSLARVSQMPWILSIVSCFVGPFAIIIAPVALTMGWVEYYRAARISRSSSCQTLPLLAICNSGLLVFSMLLFVAWTLFFVFGAFKN